MEKALLWFRQDLRLSDNPALTSAVLANKNILPIFILDDSSRRLGGASKWWLHNSLLSLSESLQNNLCFYHGNAEEIILNLVKKHSIKEVYWNRVYEPSCIERDTRLKKSLQTNDINCHSFNASLLWEPWQVAKNDGTPYKVFTPFYRKGCANAAPPRQPIAAPQEINTFKDNASLALPELNLLPKEKWHSKFIPFWQIGEKAAQQRLLDFINQGLNNYKEGRNYPAKNNVSRLSPYLHFGEISPHQIWHSLLAQEIFGTENKDIDHFKSELGWREFSYYLLYYFPDLPWKNFQIKFDNFPWVDNESFLTAWQKGQTGYPIVDAGMRELWETGYMHNRVRMIVASFLVKNLLIHWRYGEEWFWDCLVDADLANNSASWQWVAGSGADAAPYFRIFNPILQAAKFDPEGMYIRRFVPELSALPTKYLYAPWEAPKLILQAANVELGVTYPKPIVNIEESRQAALIAYHSIQAN
jgi:deoxyribodipyrimidine photo-lyase